MMCVHYHYHNQRGLGHSRTCVFALQVLFCSAIIYSGATQSVNLKEIITPDELVMEQFQKVIYI